MSIFKNLFALACVANFAAGISSAAEDRIAQAIDSARSVVLPGRVHPKAQARFDRGLADAAMPIAYATLLLKPAQELETFLAGQQNPSSPDFHRWLTPDQFGDRFGLSPNDLSKVTAWLRSQGL